MHAFSRDAPRPGYAKKEKLASLPGEPSFAGQADVLLSPFSFQACASWVVLAQFVDAYTDSGFHGIEFLPEDFRVDPNETTMRMNEKCSSLPAEEKGIHIINIRAIEDIGYVRTESTGLPRKQRVTQYACAL
uniref:Uncharacterized protein n=1 Tax=Sphaerodactylus townsendi TaxID=933632 RepID=A0ACB8G3Q7_9SAUR